MPENLDLIARLAQRTFEVPAALVALDEGERQRVAARAGLDAPGLVVCAEHPLKGPDGAVIGALRLLDRAPRELDLDQRRALRDLAGMVEEQLASSAPPLDEGARLLAALREDPERQAQRRGVRAGFLAAAAIVVAVTAFSSRMTQHMVEGAARVERAMSVAERAAAAPDLAAMRGSAGFLRGAVLFRAAVALLLLYFTHMLLGRDADSRLAAQAAVELARRRLQAVIDGIADGIVVADAKGRFTLFNPAAERILGLGVVDAPDQATRFYGSFFDKGGKPYPPAEHPLARAIAGESVAGEVLVVRNERRPGGVVVLATATPVRAFDGAPAGGVIVFRDA